MKALITNVKFVKEYESKFGLLYLHQVEYEDKKGFYSSKKKDQTYFIDGKEAEFTEEERTKDGKTYFIIKPIRAGGQSNWGRQLKKEQSRYSGFATSYVKDLIISGHIKIEDWEKASKKIFNFMVDLDKNLES